MLIDAGQLVGSMVGSLRWQVAGAALVVTLSLAGCSSTGDGTGATASSTASSSSAPQVMARIIVERDGNATLPVDGAVAATVNETLAFDASGSTGPIATYAWSFGDNATGSNQRQGHAFGVAGLYNVTLRVATLDNVTATAAVLVNVSAPLAGRPLFDSTHAIEGELPIMNPNSCTTQGVDCRDHVITIVGADANGTSALARSVHLEVHGSGDAAVHMQVFLRGPDGTTLASTPADGLDHVLDHGEAMPPGDYVLRVRLFVGAGATYTGSATVSYVSA